MYTPDGWVLVKITGTDPHYRIFGSWRGGYLDGDSWRINSGITRCDEDDDWNGEGDMLIFSGMSSSQYMVHTSTYGNLGPYNWGVINNYCENSDGKMEVLEKIPENILEFDWII